MNHNMQCEGILHGASCVQRQSLCGMPNRATVGGTKWPHSCSCDTLDGCEILHQLIGGTTSHYVQGFNHPKWFIGFLPPRLVSRHDTDTTLLPAYCQKETSNAVWTYAASHCPYCCQKHQTRLYIICPTYFLEDVFSLSDCRLTFQDWLLLISVLLSTFF